MPISLDHVLRTGTEPHRYPNRSRQALRIDEGFAHQFIQVHRLAQERHQSRIGFSEQRQSIHNPCQPLRLIQDARQMFAALPVKL